MTTLADMMTTLTLVSAGPGVDAGRTDLAQYIPLLPLLGLRVHRYEYLGCSAAVAHHTAHEAPTGGHRLAAVQSHQAMQLRGWALQSKHLVQQLPKCVIMEQRHQPLHAQRGHQRAHTGHQ